MNLLRNALIVLSLLAAGPLFQAPACPPFRPPLTKWGSFQWTRSIRL